jgi:CheY-like chemotaxis protein
MSRPTILCVDDETTILDGLKWNLRKIFGDAYSYEFAGNAEEAMEIVEELEQEGEEIQLIICDWLMPGKKGDEFLIELHKIYPKIVKIILTGQADKDAIERAKTQANLHTCLLKPWDDKEFKNALISGLDKFHLNNDFHQI